MKPLNKEERWYAFLEIVFDGSSLDELPFTHTEFGLLSQCDSIRGGRMEEIDRYVSRLWKNPPRVNYE